MKKIIPILICLTLAASLTAAVVINPYRFGTVVAASGSLTLLGTDSLTLLGTDTLTLSPGLNKLVLVDSGSRLVLVDSGSLLYLP